MSGLGMAWKIFASWDSESPVNLFSFLVCIIPRLAFAYLGPNKYSCNDALLLRFIMIEIGDKSFRLLAVA